MTKDSYQICAYQINLAGGGGLAQYFIYDPILEQMKCDQDSKVTGRYEVYTWGERALVEIYVNWANIAWMRIERLDD